MKKIARGQTPHDSPQKRDESKTQAKMRFVRLPNIQTRYHAGPDCAKFDQFGTTCERSFFNRQQPFDSAQQHRSYPSRTPDCAWNQLSGLYDTSPSRQLSSEDCWRGVLQSVRHGSLWPCTGLSSHSIRDTGKSCSQCAASPADLAPRCEPCSRLSNIPTSRSIWLMKQDGTCVD